MPAGSIDSERLKSSDLLRIDSFKLLSLWDDEFKASLRFTRYWYQKLYSSLLKDARVLEIGPGMGFDGIHFSGLAKHWTYCDVALENLEVIKRVSTLKGLSEADTLHIDGISAFDKLASDYDVVWAIGSIHHVPFELAAEESRAILRRLKPNGRWIELVYPPERWAREGAVPFERWGTMTDGESTPWVEWYNEQKLKRRLFPAVMRTILDMPLYSSSCWWIDLEHTGDTHDFEPQEKSIDLPTSVSGEVGIWRQCAIIDIDLSDMKPSKLGLALDLDCTIHRGTLGFGFLNKDGHFVGEEMILSNRDFPQYITIQTDNPAAARSLSIRNAGDSATSMTIHGAVVRPRI